MDGQLQLAVLGRVEIRKGDQPLSVDLISAKGQALLIYLAVTGGIHSRSSLADLLWSEMTEERAKANLRLTLSKLRQVLDDHLLIDRQSVAFNFEQGYWLDVAEFTTGAAQAEKAGVQPRSVERLRAALLLYRGDFLMDFYVQDAPVYEEWIRHEQERLRQLALSALSQLAEDSQQRGDLKEAIRVTRRILALEAWREEAHRQLMWLLAFSGQRTAALAQYDACRRVLAEELAVEPAAATVTLYEQIKAGVAERGSEENGLSARQMRAAPSSAHSLPTFLTPVVGRQSELAQIAHLLADPNCRLLTLIGPGGIGKTRLALAALEAELDRFQDGVRFVSLVGVSSPRSEEAVGLLINNVAKSLDYLFSAQRPPRELLLNHLAGKEMLLLLDNFEQLRPAAEFLSELLLHAPGVKILVTSRARLGIEAEWLLDVKGLGYPPSIGSMASVDEQNDEQNGMYPAVSLFVQCAQRHKAGFSLVGEQAQVNRICQLLGGFPLALELAANWVRVLSCAEIVKRLDPDQPTLPAAGLDILTTTTAVVAERHQNMRMILAYSWRLLSDEEQQLFRCASLFQGGFELSAAQEVAGAQVELLAALMDSSWLWRDEGGRYQIHELLRHYGAEQLAAHPAEQLETEKKHSQYYAHFLATRSSRLAEFPNQQVVAELDKEVDNLRSVWQRIYAFGEVEAIAAFLEGLWLYYEHKGWFQEAVYALTAVCRVGQASALQKARWHRWLGEAHYQMGHHRECREHMELAMQYVGRPLPTTKRGWAVNLVAQLVRQLMHRAWPFAVVERSLETRQLFLEGARTLGRLGQIYYFAEELVPVLSIAFQDLNFCEEAGASAELARGYATTSLTSGNIPLHGLARYYGRLAEKSAQGVKHIPTRAYVLELIGVYNLGIAQWTQATEALVRAAEILAQWQLPRWWEETQLLMAIASYHQGQFLPSMQRFGEAAESARQRGDPLPLFWALTGQAECALRLGGIHGGNVMYFLEESKALPERYLGRAELIRLYGLLALANLEQERPLEAWQAVEKAARLSKQTTFWMLWAMEGYAGVAEVSLKLWERQRGGAAVVAEQKVLAQTAGQACRTLHRFAHTYATGLPRAWRCQGLYDWLQGKPSHADRCWRKSLAAAQQLKMPYEEGCAYYEMGRHRALDDRVRRQQLACAGEIFTRLDIKHHLALAKSELWPSSDGRDTPH